MKRQGVRGRDEESYLLTLACHMSDKKKPMRKEEVAKEQRNHKYIAQASAYIPVPKTPCTGSSVCNRTIGVSSALRIKLELNVAQHEKKRKFMNMCLHIAYAFSTESDAVADASFFRIRFSSVQQIICCLHNLRESPQDQHIYVILCINLLVVVLHREDVAHRDTNRIRALLHL